MKRNQSKVGPSAACSDSDRQQLLAELALIRKDLEKLETQISEIMRIVDDPVSLRELLCNLRAGGTKEN